jgi:hypothetical protein
MSKFIIKETRGILGGKLFKVYQDGFWVGTAKTKALAQTIIKHRKQYKIRAR